MLDTFGCILGGSGAPGLADIFALLDEWGGKAESRVVLHRRSLPAPAAAMMNASMGHALDFDDTHDTAGSTHPGVSVLCAGLAMADRLGGVSGRDFVLAATLGLDVSCRIALACTVEPTSALFRRMLRPPWNSSPNRSNDSSDIDMLISDKISILFNRA